MLSKKKQLLLLMSFIMPFSFSFWMVLLNNFCVEVANFTGKEIGLLQSLREIPGFLAFTAVFVILLLKEQTFALISLLIMCLGISLVGFFPTIYGLYFTTVLMSIGFHYFETAHQSLTLQWLPQEEVSAFLGKTLAVKGVAAVLAYGLLWGLLEWTDVSYTFLYAFFGGSSILAVLFLMVKFPQFESDYEQHKHLVLRGRYWLFYALTFMSGARRQIFIVFAAFMMIEKFGYAASDIALLFLANQILNILFASKIGKWVAKIGEHRALSIEYAGLILVFAGYAWVENAGIAAVLYVIDHLFFAMAIALKSYFRKIADPADIASTAGVSFTINHIAAVVLPALLGLVWLYSPTLVFGIGCGFAAISLLLAQLVPTAPQPKWETRLSRS